MTKFSWRVLFLLLGMACAIPSLTAKEAKESFSPSVAYVGDLVEYVWEGEEPEGVEIPSGYLFSETSPGLPIGKILSSERRENAWVCKIRFYESGEHNLPISWIESGERKFSQAKIQIKSQLLGDETDIQEADPPLAFSGFRLWLLGFYVVLLLALVWAGFKAYEVWEKRDKIYDADWRKEPEVDEVHLRFLHLQDYLLEPELDERELCYRFTAFTKAELGKKYGVNLLSRTDGFALDFSFSRLPVARERLLELQTLLLSKKYGQEGRRITTAEAKALLEEWDALLQLGKSYGR